MTDLKELLERAAPALRRAVNIAELDRSADRQRARARAVGGLVAVLVVAGLLTAGLLLRDGSDTGRLDTAATGTGDGQGRTAPTLAEVEYDLDGMTVGFVPEGFKATSAHVTVTAIGPVAAGGESRVLSVTFERPSERDLPPEERPDLSITFTETAAPSAALPDTTDNEGSGYATTPVTLENGSAAVLGYNDRLAYGSVDAVLTPYLSVTVIGGPLTAEELLDVANSIDTSTFRPCALGEGLWDDRPACRRTATSSTTTVLRDDSPAGEPLRGADGDEDTTLRVGERRSIELNLHCGIGPQVQFNGRHWDLAETPLGRTGLDGLTDIPADWPRSDQGGVLFYVGLGENDEILYSLPDGRVLAVYRPAEAPAEPVPCG